MMNIYERLSIPRMTEIIGEDHVEELKNILLALNRDDINVELINTKGFMAKYLNQVFGHKYLLTDSGSRELLGTLPDDELQNILQITNAEVEFRGRDELIDSIAKLLKNKSYRSSIFCSLGFSDFDSDPKNVVEKINRIYIEKRSSPYKQLKDYQYQVLFKALALLSERASRFILQMPTGSGKTRTAIEIICTFLNENPNCSVIWLAHSTELCDQAVSCFMEIWPNLAKKDLLLQKHFGSFKFQSDERFKTGFLCASFQSLVSSVNKSQDIINDILEHKRLIVVDEAHKVVAPTYKMVTKALMSDDTVVMGLTATPGRSYGTLNTGKENEELSKFFFDTHITFDVQGDSSPIEYLRSKKILSKTTFETLSISGLNYPLTKSELDYVAKMLELPSELLSRLGKNSLRNAEIINKLDSLVKHQKFKSIIFFATSVEQSKLISALLNFLEIKAAHVDGDTPKLSRELIIREFREQKISVLCNYEVLSTGFDAPLVDCVFIARPTASVVLYSQMIGRGLRGPAIGGKEKCLIVNVRDNFINLPSINDMYSIFDVYWNH